MALLLVTIVPFGKFYFHIFLKRKFLAKPRYATFQKIALKIAYYVAGRVGCKLAPQAHGTLHFSFHHAESSFSGKIEEICGFAGLRVKIEFCGG